MNSHEEWTLCSNCWLRLRIRWQRSGICGTTEQELRTTKTAVGLGRRFSSGQPVEISRR